MRVKGIVYLYYCKFVITPYTGMYPVLDCVLDTAARIALHTNPTALYRYAGGSFSASGVCHAWIQV
jgi:hypothetical protein